METRMIHPKREARIRSRITNFSEAINNRAPTWIYLVMKSYLAFIIVALQLSNPSSGQTPDQQAAFDREWDQSCNIATTRYPDSVSADTPLGKKMGEMDNQLKASNDPLFYSPNKPLLLATRAAMELGIKPAGAPLDSAQPENTPKRETRKQADPHAFENEVWKEKWGYKSVRVRTVEPDGVRIFHESGVTKILIEVMSESDRDHYGITLEGARQYRQRLIEIAASIEQRRQQELQQVQSQPRAPQPRPTQQPAAQHSNQRIDLTQAKEYAFRQFTSGCGEPISPAPGQFNAKYRMGRLKGKTQDEALAEFESIWASTSPELKMKYARLASPELQLAPSEQEAAANENDERQVVQAPAWKRYVRNEAFQRENRQDIAEEIRRTDGPAAADNFLRQQQLKDQQEAQRRKEDEIVTLTTTAPLPGGGVFQKVGNRILLNGDAAVGYRIEGKELFLLSTGELTHVRSGNSWVPVNGANGIQIIDPE